MPFLSIGQLCVFTDSHMDVFSLRPTIPHLVWPPSQSSHPHWREAWTGARGDQHLAWSYCRGPRRRCALRTRAHGAWCRLASRAASRPRPPGKQVDIGLCIFLSRAIMGSYLFKLKRCCNSFTVHTAFIVENIILARELDLICENVVKKIVNEYLFSRLVFVV